MGVAGVVGERGGEVDAEVMRKRDQVPDAGRDGCTTGGAEGGKGREEEDAAKRQ